MKSSGWLFDFYARGGDIILWMITDDGERLRLVDSFQPLVFLEGPPEELSACLQLMEKEGAALPAGVEERRDFWSGAPRCVQGIRVLSAENWRLALDRYADRFPRIAWYNADLPAEQTYAIERDIFPLMRCTVKHKDGRLLSLQREDDRWSTLYPRPPLNIVELKGDVVPGKRPHLRNLTLSDGERCLTWESQEDMLSGLQRAIDERDPDAILTDGGDGLLLPALFDLARRQRVTLCLDRDPHPEARAIKTEGKSYWSYGQVLYKAPECSLFGRWHVDRSNSFTFKHDGMEGLFEVARLSRIPVQRIARRSIGTGISAVQIDMAWRDGFLVPWKKTAPEAWKSARQLLKTDRGGLVYAPELGFHEDVVELDFVAMYPSIMARFNVSPETVNCPCCRNSTVPEIGYTVCEKRHGVVSRALAPIIAKRVRYKELRAAARAANDDVAWHSFDARQDALKWMLVCSFGYLGYRNARFGRIEAHEAVSAYSREMLIRAREVCEANGWHMLHANVDCVWITKPGFKESEVPLLMEDITDATGLSIALEGIYRWLAFLPSREYADRPVPSRYYGVFRNGAIKFRGIECRRRDYPEFIKTAQLNLLHCLTERAHNAEEYRALMPEALRIIDDLEGQLLRHEIPLERLYMHQHLSKDPEEYAGNGSQALAAQQAAKAGLNLHGGERLSFILTSMGDKDRQRRVRVRELMDAETQYDPRAYIRLLRRAMNTLLQPAGILLDEDDKAAPEVRKKRVKKDESAQQDLFGGMAG